MSGIDKKISEHKKVCCEKSDKKKKKKKKSKDDENVKNKDKINEAQKKTKEENVEGYGELKAAEKSSGKESEASRHSNSTPVPSGRRKSICLSVVSNSTSIFTGQSNTTPSPEGFKLDRHEGTLLDAI